MYVVERCGSAVVMDLEQKTTERKHIGMQGKSASNNTTQMFFQIGYNMHPKASFEFTRTLSSLYSHTSLLHATANSKSILVCLNEVLVDQYRCPDSARSIMIWSMLKAHVTFRKPPLTFTWRSVSARSPFCSTWTSQPESKS